MNINYKHHAIIRDNTKHISRSVSELDESFSSGVIDSIIRNQTYESMYHLWVYMTKDNGTIINRLTGVMWNLLMSIYPELWTDYFIFEYQRNNS